MSHNILCGPYYPLHFILPSVHTSFKELEVQNNKNSFAFVNYEYMCKVAYSFLSRTKNLQYLLLRLSLVYILNKKFWEELIVYFPWYDTGHVKNDVSNSSSIVACVFVTAVTFLPSHCLATTGDFY
jgi:hypothetical protein